MTIENWQTTAVALMLASMPLLTWGGNEELVAVSIIGAALLVIGAGTLTALRFIPQAKE